MVPYTHAETVTIPYKGTAVATPHLWWLTAGVLLLSSLYFLLTAGSFWDILVAVQVLFGAVQLRNWRFVEAHYEGEVTKEVTFSDEVEAPYEEVWLVDPLLDEKYDLRSDTITKVYVAPVPSTLFEV